MTEGFPYVDIILFAMVAAYLVYRLRSVLGRRTGNERRRDDALSSRRTGSEADETVVKLPNRGKDRRDREREQARPPKSVEELIAEDTKVVASDAVDGIAQIRANDPTFSGKEFVAGARTAFEMIVGAFAKGDRKLLRRLLSDEVYENFNQAIKDRESAGNEVETTMVGIEFANIIEARMTGSEAFITVEFTSEQVNVTRDSEGRVIEGDPNEVCRAIDIWTFSRDLASKNPNWILVATSNPG
jgi:predicted lipid-binding transport protein (Tim44 family)